MLGSVSSVCSLVSSAASVGFSGSRRFAPPSAVASLAFGSVAPSAVVSVGCASGSDSAARVAFPAAVVFRVASFGSGRGAFARRSSAFVRGLAASPAPLLVSFPFASCPSGLFPSPSSSACFCGLGSGSWASAALAAGLGVPVLVWLPSGLSAPAGWGFASLGGGWFFRPSQLLF